MTSHRLDAACCSGTVWLLEPVPRQELANVVDGVIGDRRQHMAQLGFGVAPVQLGGAVQRVNRSALAGERLITETDAPSTNARATVSRLNSSLCWRYGPRLTPVVTG